MKAVILRNIITILNNFSIGIVQQSFLQSSVSHDPSEIILICWFGAQETFNGRV